MHEEIAKSCPPKPKPTKHRTHRHTDIHKLSTLIMRYVSYLSFKALSGYGSVKISYDEVFFSRSNLILHSFENIKINPK